MADGQQNQGEPNYGNQKPEDFFFKEQAERMMNQINNKSYSNNNFAQVSMSSNQQNNLNNPQVSTSMYMNQQQQQQQINFRTVEQQNVEQQQQIQQQQHQQQQMQQQFQQQFQFQLPSNISTQMSNQVSVSNFANNFNNNQQGGMNSLVQGQAFGTPRRGRKLIEKKKRKRHTFVKRPTTAYLYFVSKYRETLKEAGEVVPKAKIITQACAEKWRNMCEEEKEPFLELSRRDRERWLKDKALEKKPRDPNRPKRPPSAYFLFLADFRKQYKGKSDPAKEITKKAGEAWNNLSDTDKTPYYRDAQVIRNKWEQDLEKYKATAMKTPQVQNISGDGQMSGMDRSLSSHSDQQDLDEDINESHNGSLDLMQQGGSGQQSSSLSLTQQQNGNSQMEQQALNMTSQNAVNMTSQSMNMQQQGGINMSQYQQYGLHQGQNIQFSG